ncbi:MAG: hypothetical protein OQJ84_06625, partial [Xanthomonadales bacterium]|nr:hypothetical protein [Xanthomonadales bacterium]
MKQKSHEYTYGHKILFFLVFVVLVFLLRSLWTYPTEHSDAIQKYYYSAELIRTGDWSILLQIHHTMRWAAMLPQTGLTWLMGTRYEVFFLTPLLMFSLYVGLIIFSLRSILNGSQQLLLWTVLFCDPTSLLIANEYLVTGLGVTSVFAGILLLINGGQRQYLSTIAAAFLFFVAYGAHVTYLSFAAGGFLWLLFFRKKPSLAIAFATTILLFITIETLLFNYLSGWQLALGRLEALATGPHTVRALDKSPVTFAQLFLRWLDLPPPHLLLCLGFIMCGPWLIVQRRRGTPVPPVIECTFTVGFFFAVAVTFAVYSINPLTPVMPLDLRYLFPFLPFAAIISVYMLSVLVSGIRARKYDRGIFAASLCFAVFLHVFPTYKIGFYHDRFKAFMWYADKEYTEFSEGFEQGRLILTGNKRVAFSMIARFKNPVP